MKVIKHVNYFLLIVLICFSVIGCSQSKSIDDDDRKETMTKIIKAVAANDKISIPILIDTSFCYSIIGEEGFSLNVNSLNKILSENKIVLNNSDFKIIPSEPKNTTWYKIVFPLQTNDKFDSIAVEFQFDYLESRKVYFFEVLYFAKPGKEEPLEKIYQDR